MPGSPKLHLILVGDRINHTIPLLIPSARYLILHRMLKKRKGDLQLHLLSRLRCHLHDPCLHRVFVVQSPANGNPACRFIGSIRLPVRRITSILVLNYRILPLQILFLAPHVLSFPVQIDKRALLNSSMRPIRMQPLFFFSTITYSLFSLSLSPSLLFLFLLLFFNF